VAPHPQHHVGDHHHGDGPDDGLEPLLLLLGQLGRDDVERHPDGDADGHGDRNSHEDLAQRIAAALLTEERCHDAHDDRRLHALSQSDHERRQQISAHSQLT
jgi:hypothetical protein